MCAYSVFNTFPVYPLSAKPLILLAFCRYRYHTSLFDRPSFERLIGKIKTGEINCVIVKDFSRFGRDYIELGDYLERIFPFIGVRFISVNDHYDSRDYKGTTGGLDVVMKNIVYDYYSKDLSVKVRSAKLSKMKQGKYQGGHIPYGLMKDPANKGKLMPDPEAAQVVREIFGYAVQNTPIKSIVEKLNSAGYEPPGAYYRRKHPESKKFANASRLNCWTGDNVRKILEQEMYYGAVAQHKRESIGIGGKHTRAVPKEEQIIIENVHEPIVSKETFEKVQQILQKHPNMKPRTAGKYPLRGHIRCAVCGRRLRYCSYVIRGVKYSYYYCIYSRYQDGTQCHRGYIWEDKMNELVLREIQKLQEMSEQATCRLAGRRFGTAEKRLASVNALRDLQKALEKNESEKFSNVDAMMAGTISKDQYQKRRQMLAEQEKDLKRRIEEAEKQDLDERMEESDEAGRTIEKIRSFKDTGQLTPEMVSALVKDVWVTDPKHIEIQWNFSDEVYKFVTEE